MKIAEPNGDGPGFSYVTKPDSLCLQLQGGVAWFVHDRLVRKATGLILEPHREYLLHQVGDAGRGNVILMAASGYGELVLGGSNLVGFYLRPGDSVLVAGSTLLGGSGRVNIAAHRIAGVSSESAPRRETKVFRLYVPHDSSGSGMVWGWSRGVVQHTTLEVGERWQMAPRALVAADDTIKLGIYPYVRAGLEGVEQPTYLWDVEGSGEVLWQAL